MTFEEWWEGNRSDCMVFNREMMANNAWQAATLAERERCAKVLDAAAKERDDNCKKWPIMRPTFEHHAAMFRSIAADIRSGGSDAQPS